MGLSAAISFKNIYETARWSADRPRSLRSLGLLVAAVVIGLNLLIAALIGSFLVDFSARERREARRDVENLSSALDAGLNGVFSQIDLVVQTVADEYQRELRTGGVLSEELQPVLDQQAERLPDVAGIRIVDADGDLRYASHNELTKPINLADREYFRELRDNLNAGLVISKPEFDQITHNWIVLFSRRVTDADGAFAGEVHVALSTQQLEKVFAALDMGPHGVVALRNSTAEMIARFPTLMKPDGGPSPVTEASPELRELIAEGRDGVAYHSFAPTDGAMRISFMRKVGRFPLFIIVGTADIDWGVGWNEVAAHLASLCALFFVATVVGGFLAYSRGAAQTRAEAQSRLAASVYENSSEGMMVLDGARRIVDVNRAFTRLTGFMPEAMRGRSVGRLFPLARDVGRIANAARSLVKTNHWSGEMWLRRADDAPFLARFSVSLIGSQPGPAGKYVAQFSDATEQKRAEETIWRQANFDAVTQLPNRRQFCDRLRSEILKANAARAQLAVIFIDLDRFKDVNDRFGHEVGDKLLTQAAERIRSCVRSNDLVARLGGDEFTVMLTDIRGDEAPDRIAREIATALARPYTLAATLSFSSASLGVTLYPRDGGDVETLLRNADQAMYAAKRAGRNRVAHFAPALQAVTSARASLASDLHGALANNELELFYQPIAEIGSGRVAKAEALLRWRYPRHGLVSPAEFIPLAEETGLIVEIGDWVFRRAAAQALKWRRAHDPRFQISVNVSAVQLTAPDGAAANFDRLIARPGLGPSSMIIEITESVLLDATSTMRQLFARYRAAGFEIALDDFGTGYSSLAYLKDFEINYLKVDRAFVSSLAERSRDYEICEAVVAMAHKLGIRVVAEGVETDAQCNLLAKAGCDYAQGYLISPPVPAAEFEARIFQQCVRVAS